MKYLLITLLLTLSLLHAADIKVIYNNTSGFQSEHSEADDSVKFKSFKTATKELTDAKLSKLIDAADASGEHVHGADDVTDFDTEVSNNTDVAANTSSRHVAVTVSDSSEIDHTLTVQQISSSIVSGSIDESKLDTSVNSSLDLADSSSQPGHTHVAADTTDFDTEVSNNSDVSANTSLRHSSATVSDSSEINLSVTGQDITAALINGSIDEARLDTSVNASLDLADSASQPGHTHTASNVTDFDTEVSNNTDVAANTADRHVAATVLDSSTVDFSISGQQVTGSVIDSSISNAKLATMPTLTIKGNDTGSTASADDLTATEVTAMLDVFEVNTDLLDGVKGLVPTPIAGEESYFLNAGTGWTSINISNLGSIGSDKLLGRISGGSGQIEEVDFSDFGQSLVSASGASSARSTIDAQEDLSGLSIFTTTVATDDKVLVQDTSGSNNLRTVTTQAIANLAQPPGVNTQVIFNDSGAYGADAGMTYNKASNQLNLIDGYLNATISSSTALLYGSELSFTDGSDQSQMSPYTFQISDGTDLLKLIPNYLNFSSTGGSSGYGIRNNGGTVEAKNSGGSWTPVIVTPSSSPVGSIVAFAGSTEPTDWIFCYGQAISRTTYSALFTAIGTTYGAGDGSTTFNLPDLRGRVVAGQDDMGGTSANRLTNQTNGVEGDTLGAVGGEETHSLTGTQVPSHTHSVTAGTASNTQTGGGAVRVNSVTATTGANSTAGTGAAHNIVQPTIIMNYIIKY